MEHDSKPSGYSEDVLAALSIYRPDEVAECMDVPAVTYSFLWNEIVPDMPRFVGDNYTECSVEAAWPKLPEVHHYAIVEAIEKYES